MRQLCHLTILLAVLWLGPAAGNIVDSKVASDGRNFIRLTDAFGFAAGGKIEITMKKIVVNPKQQQLNDLAWDNFGLFLLPVREDVVREEKLEPDSTCPLHNVPANYTLFTFKKPVIQDIIKKKAPSYTLNFTVKEGNLVYLCFANCESDTSVSFQAHIVMYNEYENGRRDYLSVGDRELDVVYWVMFAAFTAAALVWGWFVYKQKAHAHKIHYLMLGLAAFKALTLLSQALMIHYIETTGHADGWNIAYYVFTFFRGILFFTVIVLVGTGWSYMKPFLGDKEKRILMVVIPLQVFANIAIIITEEESPAEKDWFTWWDVFHLVDIICCCAILFPIVWSVKHLREASQTDGKAARNLQKLTLFRQFYVMVVVYIYFTRIVVYLLKSTLQYEYTWVSEAADEVATLLFYLWTAVNFRPHDANPYLELNVEEIEIAG